MTRKFKVATAAGTFDHFHKGHEYFLASAFAFADTIYIGITSIAFGKSKRQINEVSPFAHRKGDVETFLKANRLLERSQIIELHDIYGPTLEKDCPIEAIIVTKKTRYGAELINKLRRQKGLAILSIEEIPYIYAENRKDLSSSRIRAGEIDRQGKLFIKREWLEKDLRLPDELRAQLQKPIGELIKGSEDDLNQAVAVIKKNLESMSRTLLVTVGDIVAQSFNSAKLQMDLAIVDYHVKREEKFKNLSEIGFTKKEPDVTVENPKGTLTVNTFRTVQETFLSLRGVLSLAEGRRSNLTTPYVIRVIGEEDLATLAVILAAPLGTSVFYGQPNEGIVQVVVTEEKKSEIREIVSHFH